MSHPLLSLGARCGVAPLLAAATVLVLALVGCAGNAPAPAAYNNAAEVVADASQPPLGKLPTGVAPLGYRLHLVVNPEAERFQGEVQIELTLDQPRQQFWLHGKDLAVTAVTYLAGASRTSGRWQQATPGGTAQVLFEQPLPAGRGVLEVAWDAGFKQGPEGLFRGQVAGASYAWTQFEPVDARLMFPSFDEPRFKVPFAISLDVPTGLVAISNGPELKREPRGQGMERVTFATTRPLPAYLVAVAVGPMDLVAAAPVPGSPQRPLAVPLRAATTAGNGALVQRALASTPEQVLWLEDWFDVAYPYAKLDLIGVPPMGFAAMENAAAITYGTSLLHLAEDAPPQLVRSFMNTHAHELGHQWFGNLVTPEWWEDLWLNEAFASWIAHKASVALYPELGLDNAGVNSALQAMDLDSRANVRRVREPITDTADANSAFDSITYQKGSAVLTMFESWLGADQFQAGVRLHMRRFADGVASSDDFMASLAAAADDPRVVPAFRGFVDQTGVPLLAVQARCQANQLQVQLRQSRYLPLGSEASPERQWQLPVCLHNASGRQCILLEEPTGNLTLPGCDGVLVPNAEGHGYYRFSLPADQWNPLLAALPELSVAEAMVAMDSLEAGFWAGQVAMATLAAGVTAAAASDQREVRLAPLGLLRALSRQLPDDNLAARAGLRRFVSATYGPILRSLEGRSDLDAVLTRTSVTSLLLVHGNQPDAFAELAASGRRVLAAPGDALQLDQVEPAQLRNALTAAVLAAERQDAAGGRQLLSQLGGQLLAIEDRYVASALVLAMGSSRNPDNWAELQKVLTDPALDPADFATFMYVLPGNPVHGPAFARWVLGDLDAVMARLPAFMQTSMPQVAAPQCSAAFAELLQTSMGARAEELGAEKNYLRAQEDIRLCLAAKQQLGPAIAAWASAQ